MANSIPTQLGAGFKHILDKAGTQIKVNYYNQTAGSIYDDDVILSLSGTTWTSGVIMSVSAIAGGPDSILKEQGLITDMDKALFTSGNLPMTGSTMQCKVQVGSPIGENYSVIDLGKFRENIVPQALGTQIYKKTYIRTLKNGSLIGEV
jgi:hypothetical protein